MPSTRDQLQLKSKLFRGLSDPSRLSIVEALREGTMTVSQVVAKTGLSQPNASMHLDCLWCCGLVDREVRGRFTYYWIASKRFVRILEVAEQVLDQVAERIEQCRRYEEKPGPR